MTDKQTIALKRLGYRPMGKGAWGKPVAYHLFLVKDGKWSNHFVGADGNHYVWSSKSLDPKDYESSIAFAEYETRTDVGGATVGSRFGFMTAADHWEGIL